MTTRKSNFNKSLALTKRSWRKQGPSTGTSPTITYPDVVNSDLNIPIGLFGWCIRTQTHLQSAVNHQDNFIVNAFGTPLGNANIDQNNVMTEVFNG